MGILQRGAFRQRSVRGASGRVAQDVDELRCREAQNVLGTVLGLDVQHVGLQRLGLIVGAVHLERHGHRVQGVVARQQVGCLGGLDDVVALSQRVQLQRVAVGGTHHAVVDGDDAAGEVYHVEGVALRVVVIIVFLDGRDGEAILAVDVEHGVAEGVAGLKRVALALGPVRLPHAVGQCQLLLRAREVLVAVVAFAEVVEGVEALLAVFDEHRRVVDATVLGVVLLHGVGHRVRGLLPRALQFVFVRGDGVRQVYHVARLAVLEQGGVARGRDLLYLPLHGRQQHIVLAGQRVGIDYHAVLRGVYARLVDGLIVHLVGQLVQECLVALLQRAVLDVEHQSRGVVAL